MRRVLSNLFMALSALCFAIPAFAQGGEAGGTNWVAIAAGFSMAIALPDAALARATPLRRLPRRWREILRPAPEFSSR